MPKLVPLVPYRALAAYGPVLAITAADKPSDVSFDVFLSTAN